MTEKEKMDYIIELLEVVLSNKVDELDSRLFSIEVAIDEIKDRLNLI